MQAACEPSRRRDAHFKRLVIDLHLCLRQRVRRGHELAKSRAFADSVRASLRAQDRWCSLALQDSAPL